MTTKARPLVLHVIDSLGRSGGAEQQLVANLRRFDQSRLRHQVLCLYAAGASSRTQEIPEGVVVDHLLPDGVRSRNRAVLTLGVYRYVRRLRPTLVHCALPDAALSARIAGALSRTLVVESLVNISHEPIRTVDNTSVTPLKLALHRVIDRITMRSVDRFHALSPKVARSWREVVGLDPARMTVIPRGIDAAGFRGRSEDTRRAVLTELGLPESTFLILNIGRQVPQKGQIYLIRALPAIRADVPNAVLVSVGSQGPSTSELLDATDKQEMADAVRLLGIRDDIPRLLAAADVFVFPSLYEGLGVALLEAMASGLPCVTTDQDPMAEVVAHEESGLLVPLGDPAAIAEAVTRLARDPDLCRRLGDRARQSTLERFDLNRTAADIEKLYLDVIEGVGRS